MNISWVETSGYKKESTTCSNVHFSVVERFIWLSAYSSIALKEQISKEYFTFYKRSGQVIL